MYVLLKRKGYKKLPFKEINVSGFMTYLREETNNSYCMLLEVKVNMPTSLLEKLQH